MKNKSKHGNVLLEWETTPTGGWRKHIHIAISSLVLFFVFSSISSLLVLYNISMALNDYLFLIGGFIGVTLVFLAAFYKFFRQKIKVVLTDKGIMVCEFPIENFRKWEELDSYEIMKDDNTLKIYFKKWHYVPFTIPIEQRINERLERVISQYLPEKSIGSGA